MANNESREKRLLRDIREFVRFLSSLWGLLAAGSLFFPYINVLTNSLPFPSQGAQGASTALAVLWSAFTFLIIFLTRRLITALDDPNLRLSAASGYRKLPLAGYRSPLLATFAFITFIIVLVDYLNASWTGAYFPQNLIRPLTLGVVQYALLFALATFSFSLLAASEYMKQLSIIERQSQRVWPSLENGMNALYLRLPPDERKSFNDFVILSESRSEQSGRLVLHIVVKSRRPPEYAKYEITIDNSVDVLGFKKINPGGS